MFLIFFILLIVLEKTDLEEMIGMDLSFFSRILEINQFLLKNFAQDLVNGLHLHSKV